MNKRTFLAILVFMFVFSAAAQAGLINYNRRAKRQARRPAPVATKAPQALSSEQVFKNRVNALITSEPAVRSRAERMYDMNRDGVLSSKEIKDFLSDVVSSVERRGFFQVTSDLLRIFDKDGNGQIDSYESFEIKNFL